MNRYAEGTNVTPERSRAEIERLVQRYGARDFSFGYNEAGAYVGFRAGGRVVLFELPTPRAEGTTQTARNQRAQEVRRRWRALASTAGGDK